MTVLHTYYEKREELFLRGKNITLERKSIYSKYSTTSCIANTSMSHLGVPAIQSCTRFYCYWHCHLVILGYLTNITTFLEIWRKTKHIKIVNRVEEQKKRCLGNTNRCRETIYWKQAALLVISKKANLI